MAHLKVKTPGGTTYSIDLDAINANGGSAPSSGNGGWGILTNGAILQWGLTSPGDTVSTPYSVPFNQDFTNAVYCTFICHMVPTTSTVIYDGDFAMHYITTIPGESPNTLKKFYLKIGGGVFKNYYWMAIGK